VRSHVIGWRAAAGASVIAALSLASLLAPGEEDRTRTTQEGAQTSPTGGPSSPTVLHAPRVSKLVAAALEEGGGKKGAAVIKRFRAKTGCDVDGSVREREVNPLIVHSEVRQFLEATRDVGVALGRDQVVIVAVSC
jgi:hypothetical protein